MHDDTRNDESRGANELPPELEAAFDYQKGEVAANTPKMNSLLTSGVLWGSALFMTAYIAAILAPIIGEGDTAMLVVLAIFGAVFLTHGLISFGAIVLFQHLMRYIEVDFKKRKIDRPSNAVVPFGLPRRQIPFNDVADIRVVSQTFSTGKSMHKFEFMPYHDDKPLATLSVRRDKDYDPAPTLEALKRTVLTSDTPSDDIFHSALTKVPEAKVPENLASRSGEPIR